MRGVHYRSAFGIVFGSLLVSCREDQLKSSTIGADPELVLGSLPAKEVVPGSLQESEEALLGLRERAQDIPALVSWRNSVMSSETREALTLAERRRGPERSAELAGEVQVRLHVYKLDLKLA